MADAFKIDRREFDRALKALGRTVREEAIPGFVNQVALDVTVKTFEEIPPKGEPWNKRNEISRFLREQRSTRVKLAKRGKRAGRYIRAVSRARELIVANLLANYWRGKKGQKGLYGTAMKRYTGKLTGSRTRGVGFNKAIWMPVIRGLNAVAKYKVSYARLFYGIAQWPGSKGKGVCSPAQSGWRPTASFNVGISKLHNNQDGKVLAMQTQALEAAFQFKAGKMDRQLERMVGDAADKAGIKHS